MRKILFRGKPTKDANVHNELKKQMVNGFVLGSLVTGNQPYIFGDITYDEKEDNAHLSWWIPVVAETVGQFTGLLDKHGRKIFEGDIVVTCPSPLSISDGGDISKRLVVNSWLFTDMCHSAMCRKSSKREKFYKIVGNIHDNPELMEVPDENK